MEVIRGHRQCSDDFERCFIIETTEPLTPAELEKLRFILAETFEPDKFSWSSLLEQDTNLIVEIGPRLSFATSFSTNAVAICHAIGMTKITRIEMSRRKALIPESDRNGFVRQDCDKMTECEYQNPLGSFQSKQDRQAVRTIPVLEKGKLAIAEINEAMGLGMDLWDIAYYADLFRKLGRNPTDVELFQLGTANSEHSRHGFFKGKMVIDGEEMPQTLMQLIQSALKRRPSNSVIAFKDNSSAIKGYDIWTIVPEIPGCFSRLVKTKAIYHILFTAETHNFPSGVAPFPGAETGTGGRIRDVHATGRGALKIAGTAGFCVGALHIPGFEICGEGDESRPHPESLALPLQVLLEESAGAWDYGNKIGEPVICGFTRNCDMRLPNGERRAWLKPIMFSGGIGQIDSRHLNKDKPKKDMLIIQVGGPAYRIGLGGGSASSMMQGENKADLDFNAVQRGDAQMENKVDRVIRACVEMGDDNPICVIHDQGAGGPCNVLTELIDPVGGRIDLRKINLGDPTMSDLEIWGAEYQERDGLLIWENRLEEFLAICLRERVACEVLGEITGDGKVVVYGTEDENPIVDLPLKEILGQIPQKTFTSDTAKENLKPLEIPKSLTLIDALRMVLQQLSVCSKEGLLNRVDRSVTGLIARQQFCGPVQLPVADVGVVAQSHFGLTGAATAIGEQPMKMLVDEEAGARMAVAEMITNMAAALISGLGDIKSSVNWMWAAKLPGEGAAIYKAAVALVNFIIELQGAEPDGGKDSLSMAAKVGDEMVKAPGQVVVSGYVPIEDIRRVITPDIKNPGRSGLLWINLEIEHRLGGSAFAQALGQIGDESPDINPTKLRLGFNVVQELQRRGLITAIHDISDGGLITTILEMAFAGNCGLDLEFSHDSGQKFNVLFAEEAGWVVEYNRNDPQIISEIRRILQSNHFGEDCCQVIGFTKETADICVRFNGEIILNEKMFSLLSFWRRTSFELVSATKADSRYVCRESSREPRPFKYKINFDFGWTVDDQKFVEAMYKPKVAILREEGTNGDREMASAFWLAGFDTFDVTMTDLISGKVSLSEFQGLVFPGGFSFADVFGSAKGWASVIKFSPKVADEISAFIEREDTFIFGVCNGCQLMTLLGIVPAWRKIKPERQMRFISNASGVFESRWVNLSIIKNNSIFLKGMSGSVLGVWVAHGEGRFYCPDRNDLMSISQNYQLTPLRYNLPDAIQDPINCWPDFDYCPDFDCWPDIDGYPYNPNGSPFGIAGLSSANGRFLALMPHPERVFLPWQWPYIPPRWRNYEVVSPWFQLFRNARNFCRQS